VDRIWYTQTWNLLHTIPSMCDGRGCYGDEDVLVYNMWTHFESSFLQSLRVHLDFVWSLWIYTVTKEIFHLITCLFFSSFDSYSLGMKFGHHYPPYYRNQLIYAILHTLNISLRMYFKIICYGWHCGISIPWKAIPSSYVNFNYVSSLLLCQKNMRVY
jgi:hypothetical protein